MWKRRAWGLIQALLALALVAWALRSVGWSKLRELSEIRPRWSWLTLGLGLGFASVLGWAWRWHLLLRAVGFSFSFREVWKLTFIADFFNLYFLGPMGADGVRFAMLSDRAAGRRVELLGTLAVDHLMGLQALALGFFAFTLPLWPWLTSISGPYGVIVEVAAVVLAVSGVATGVLLWPIGRRLVAGFFAKCSSSKLGAKIVGMMRCLDRRPGLMWASVAVSLASLCCAYGAFWSAAKALDADLSPRRLFALMPIVDAYAMLPITVSGVGVRENLFLALLGQENNLGAARAVAVSLLGFVCVGVWGLVGGGLLAMHRRGRPERGS